MPRRDPRGRLLPLKPRRGRFVGLIVDGLSYREKQRMVHVFAEDTFSYIAGIQHGVEMASAAEIESNLCALQGICLWFGEKSIANMCGKLRRCTKEREAWETALDSLYQVLQTAQVALEKRAGLHPLS